MDTKNRPIESAYHLTEEHDAVPLKQRLKMLIANKPRSSIAHTKFRPQIAAIDSEGRAVKKEAESISKELRSDYFLGEERVERLLQDECYRSDVLKGGMPQECCIQRIEPSICNSTNQLGLSELNPGTVRAEEHFVGDFAVNNLPSSVGRCLNGSSDGEDQTSNIKIASPYNMFDGLDHIDLRERRKLLLSRKSLESAKPVREGSASRLPKFVVGCLQNADIGNEACSSEGFHSDDIPERSAVFCKNLEPGSSRSLASQSSEKIHHYSVSVNQSTVPGSTLGNDTKVHENGRISSSKIPSNDSESCGAKDVYTEKKKDVLNSTLSSFLNVKVESVYTNEVEKNALDNTCLVNTVSVKNELNITDVFSNDVIDHMLLRDRMNLRMSKRFQNFNICAEDSRKIEPSTLDSSPISSEYATPLTIKRTRKRKKTSTDSVATALEEDAPELLQALVDKGVVVDEIKLYGQTEIDEALDHSLTEDSFTELEAVISKLFSQRHSLLKFPLLRGSKGEKTSYCLACLISLIEQARYLQFRKWPVEWGWCRDLQSFIFVFERHHRIALERPEYGYATYFFELLDSVPIDWQIKRLVTAMKLTSCSRITLIENKALTVGEDLTQAEAAVLTGYGWILDTGLGTMLNYRDRVVHDRKNEKDSSEWRSKIGKLLMDGFNGGTIITDILQKIMEYDVACHQIKLEL